MTSPHRSTLYYIAIALLLSQSAVQVNAQGTSVTGINLSALTDSVQQAENEANSDSDTGDGTKELLARAKQRLRTAANFEAQAEQYADSIEEAPRKLAAFERQTISGNVADNFVKLPVNAEQLPLDELRNLLARKELNSVTSSRRLKEITDQIKSEKDYDIQGRLQELDQLPLPDNPPSGASAVERRAQTLFIDATKAVRDSEITMLEQRQVSRSARLSILEAERALESLKVRLLDSDIAQLNTWITEHRQSEAERLAKSASLLITREGVSSDLAGMAREIQDSSSSLIKLINQHQQMDSNSEATTLENERIRRRYESLERQLASTDLSSTPEFGAALRQYRDQLIDFDSAQQQIEQSQRKLTQARLAQFRLESADATDSATARNSTETLAETLRADRTRLDDLLLDAYTAYIDDLAVAITRQEQLLTNSRNYADLINKHLLWMPSARPLSVKTFSDLPGALAWLVAPANWRQLGLADPARLIVAMLLVIAGSLVLMARSRIEKYFADTAHFIGKVNHDSIQFSINTLILTCFMALAIPLFLLALRTAVADTGSFAVGVNKALLAGALVIYVTTILLKSVLPKGLGETHFLWHSSTLQALRNDLPWFSISFALLVMINVLIETAGTAAVRDSIGRITFIAGTLILAVFAYKFLVATRKSIVFSFSSLDSSQRWSIRFMVLPLVVILPVLIAILSVFGYHYTAIKLDTKLILSGVLMLVSIYVFYLALRGLSISERRYTLKSLKEQRERQRSQNQQRRAANASGDAVPDSIDTERIDVQKISDQTKALVKMIVFVATIIGLWSIWSNLFSSFQALETIELYSTTELIDNVSTAVPITLWDIILSIVIALVTYVGAKNIPGSLEVALLSRMSLQQGTSYAITTICRYLIVIVGSITVLQMLGAQWSKLQWLVAALSVGLGFGLQEIVANFVSGIVLLFERPIRIGDTVTVGDQMGTVSKIRIRATTILDWDNKEVIIPNKSFITERLMNWTLSDATTRKTIKVGVAYGSDVNLTEELLLKIAKDCEGVQSEPAPAALFLGFGSSSLDFELRIFIRSIREILPVTHRLHKEIDRRFRENGIEIAFPQQDIHFDERPIEVTLIDSKTPAKGAGEDI